MFSEGLSDLHESLSGTHFAEHFLETAGSKKPWLQSDVAPSFLPSVLGPIRHNEDAHLSARQDILLIRETRDQNPRVQWAFCLKQSYNAV